MSVSAEVRRAVRERAHFACEYCGVTETDAGGELTLDHFHPRTLGGSDALENLIYCCARCNQYKADYWPTQPASLTLWNPRQEPPSKHLLQLADGLLYPISATGSFTLQRLRLNRPALVAWRVRQLAQSEERRLLTRYQDLLKLLEQMQQEQAALLVEHRSLLEEQRLLLKLLIEART